MSEKRFRANFNVSIYDSEKEEYISVSERGLEEIAKRMNQLQDKITELEIELTDCKNRKEQSEYKNTRFTIQKASGMYLHLPIFDNDVEMADGDVCILLNEQQATIKKLEEENRELRQSVEYWQKKYEEGTETFQIN